MAGLLSYCSSFHFVQLKLSLEHTRLPESAGGRRWQRGIRPEKPDLVHPVPHHTDDTAADAEFTPDIGSNALEIFSESSPPAESFYILYGAPPKASVSD